MLGCVKFQCVSHFHDQRCFRHFLVADGLHADTAFFGLRAVYGLAFFIDHLEGSKEDVFCANSIHFGHFSIAVANVFNLFIDYRLGRLNFDVGQLHFLADL